MRQDVILEQLADQTGPTIIGLTSGTNSLAPLTAAQATAILNAFSSGDKGLTPASGGGTTNFLRADGSWAAPPTGSLADGDKGDITVSASGATWTLDANIVKNWTGAQTWTDNNFSILDNVDNTKILQFQVSGLTTATTRTLTIPDANGTILLGTGVSGRIPYFNAINVVTSEDNFEYDAINNRIIAEQIGSDSSVFAITPPSSANSVQFRLQETSSNTFLNFSHSNNANSVITGGLDNATVRHFVLNTHAGTGTNNGPDLVLESGNCANGTAGDIILTPGLDSTSGSKGRVLINTTSGTAMLQVNSVGSASSPAFLLTVSGTQTFEIVNNGNVGIGQGTYGGASGAVMIANATVNPSSNPTNSTLIHSKDVDSSSELYVRTESGAVVNMSGLLDPVVVSATTLTLSETHRNKFVYFTSASAITVTVPNSLAKGFNCVLMQDSTGAISITGSGGTVINGKTATTGIYDTVSLVHYKDTDIYFGR